MACFSADFQASRSAWAVATRAARIGRNFMGRYYAGRRVRELGVMASDSRRRSTYRILLRNTSLGAQSGQAVILGDAVNDCAFDGDARNRGENRGSGVAADERVGDSEAVGGRCEVAGDARVFHTRGGARGYPIPADADRANARVGVR